MGNCCIWRRDYRSKYPYLLPRGPLGRMDDRSDVASHSLLIHGVASVALANLASGRLDAPFDFSKATCRISDSLRTHLARAAIQNVGTALSETGRAGVIFILDTIRKAHWRKCYAGLTSSIPWIRYRSAQR